VSAWHPVTKWKWFFSLSFISGTKDRNSDASLSRVSTISQRQLLRSEIAKPPKMPKSKKVATPNPDAGANPTATSGSKSRKRKNVERDDGYDVQSGNTSHPSPAVPQADVPLSVGGDDAPRETPSKKPRNEETSPATEQTEKRLRRYAFSSSSLTTVTCRARPTLGDGSLTPLRPCQVPS
jgi:hypothetical protein